VFPEPSFPHRMVICKPLGKIGRAKVWRHGCPPGEGRHREKGNRTNESLPGGAWNLVGIVVSQEVE
jgi:hypothetical protein